MLKKILTVLAVIVVMALIMFKEGYPFTDTDCLRVMEREAAKFRVDPNFLKAVASVESRKGNQKFRYGKMGRTYYGPMGIHKCFLKKWDIDKPEINIMVGARALQGVGSNPAAQKKRLRRYNASFNERYWRAIKQAEREFAWQKLSSMKAGR